MKFLFVAVAAIPVVYFGAALILTAFAPNPGIGGQTVDFERLERDGAEPAPLGTFAARDGADLGVAHYRAETPRKLIVLHGSGWHGRYFATAARFFSERGLADVYAPNIRGHFRAGPTRGDIHHVGQLEEDIADLIASIRKNDPDAFVVLGGHSSGGALAIRFANGPFAGSVDAYLAVAPFLGHRAPTFVADAGGWAHPSVPRIVGLTMLNNAGIRALDHLPTLAFNLPERYRDGTETLAYSHRLTTNINLRGDFEADIASLPHRALVLVGRDDEAMRAAEFPALFGRLTKAEIMLLDGVGHLDAVSHPAMLRATAAWLDGLPEKR